MDFNSNEACSLNIMEYSLCLDDHSALNATTTTNKNNNKALGNTFSHLKSTTMSSHTKFDKHVNTSLNTFNSFYLTNESDTNELVKDNPFHNINEEIECSNDDDDEIVFNLNKAEYKSNKTNDNDINKKVEIKPTKKAEEQSSTMNNCSNSNSNNNVIELDTVKHKLSSLWNNVKYGWSNYLKKPSKMELNSYEPIYILGKKFLYNELDDNYYKHDKKNKQILLKNNSNSIEINLSNKHQLTNTDMNSLSESYISAPTCNLDDYLAMNMSYFSTSPLDSNSLTFENMKAKQAAASSNNVRNFSRFLNDNMKSPLDQEIFSRLWFTYRKDFEPLDGKNRYTTDCGWGCMLRSAQMLIAQGLLVHLFSKDWSLYKSLSSAKACAVYKEIICLFNDRPSLSCPFGLHRLLEIADEKLSNSHLIDNVTLSPSSSFNSLENTSTSNKTSNKSNNTNSRVGTWFGPTSVCLLMKDALNESLKTPNCEILNNIRIYVAQDCTIFKQDVINLCTMPLSSTTNASPSNATNSDATKPINIPSSSSSSPPSFIPCIILISARLGGEELNEIYVDSLKMFLELDTCIGIIGGKPKHSLYFLGYQGDKVIYLDPHFCQPTVNIFSNSSLTNLTTSMTILSSDVDTCHSLSSSMSNSSSNAPHDEYFDNSSFHCSSPSKVSFTKLDPSIAIGFYCQNLDQLNGLCHLVKEAQTMKNIYPIFGVSDGSFEQVQLNFTSFSYEEHKVSDVNVKKKPTTTTKPPVKNISSYLLTNKITKSISSAPNKLKSKSPKKIDPSEDFVLV
jgi:cysteine protease ATG4